ncbi:hypothetical protein PPL_10194 [Heterostelium album PN500]|uniref:EGF-like domain-containing protein n=1 Tax=Heterostelium pallidum (strain ATCC 26659 / Pp 5 / PN500) TaxID=670386 RepID=D3BQK9_HETP5|nr:hypothetical protein PPL_10194 [Heterostelium album PN500]EFA76429.1 hypothetical protein PPL_10194 [Heterostelium album PN500]|eukprot:XP_020428561.1 hypothetical protein PPL_10194 [Heterostelium album PN500]
MNCIISNYTLDKEISLDIQSKLQNISSLTSLDLIITSISNITNNGGHITIVGNFGTNAYFPQARVLTDGDFCGLVTFNATALICSIRAGYEITTHNISVTRSGQEGFGNLNVVPPVDDCGANSLCNSNGRCYHARCQCFNGYNGFYCESKIDSGVVVLPDDHYPSPTVVTTTGFLFKFNVIAVQELDPLGEIVDEVITNQWNYSVTSNSTLTTHSYMISRPGQSTTIEATIDYSSLERSIKFAGITTIYQAQSLKLMIALKQWNFQDKLNIIRVIMESEFEAEKKEKSECGDEDEAVSDIGIDSITDNMKFVKVTYGDKAFYGRFLPFAMADKRSVAVENRVLNITTVSNTTKAYISMTLPYCDQQCIIDPDFSLLIDTGASEVTCKSKEKSKAWLIATVVVVVSVVLIAAAITAYMLSKKIAKQKREHRNMQQKLQKFASGQ